MYFGQSVFRQNDDFRSIFIFGESTTFNELIPLFQSREKNFEELKSTLLDADLTVLAAHVPTVHRLSIPGLCPLKKVQLAMSSLLDEIRKQVEVSFLFF